MRKLIVVLVLIATSVTATAQTLSGASRWADSASREIDAASMSGDAARLAAVQTLLDKALADTPNDALLLHYKGLAYYRAINIAAPGADIGVIARKAGEALESSNAARAMAENYILLTAIYGREILLDPNLGAKLGADIQNATGQAMVLGSTNPRVLLVRGQGALFSPPEWGGGAEIAAKLLERAVELYATDHPVAPAPSWGRAEAYAWLGQAYERLGRKAEAITAYKKAIEIQPNYLLVANVFMPAIMKGASP